jgi:catechol 2,3-dioxygenase-like lactoylglutathione lyase family enzyme
MSASQSKKPLMLRANATVMVSDIGRSLEFYTRVLGLSEGARHLDHFVEVEAPGLTIVLHPGRRKTGSPPTSDLSIGIQVADLRTATEELKTRGLSFTHLENRQTGSRSSAIPTEHRCICSRSNLPRNPGQDVCSRAPPVRTSRARRPRPI